MSTVDFLVKLRDALQMAVDACNEYLESLVPPEAKDWNPANIKWQQTEGPSGPYERATAEDNKGISDFEVLMADLNAHNGKLTRNGFFYWLFSNGDAVGCVDARSTFKLVREELWAFLRAKGFPNVNERKLREATSKLVRQACTRKRLELEDRDFTEGGTHVEDVAVVYLLAKALGLKQGVDWDWTLEPDGYHLQIAYRSRPKLQELFRLLDLFRDARATALTAFLQAENKSQQELQQRFQEAWTRIQKEKQSVHEETLRALRKALKVLKEEVNKL